MRCLLLAGLLSLGAVPVDAMTVTVEQRAPRLGTLSTRPAAPTIRMTGMIERGDAEVLRKTLERMKATTPGPDGTLATVELSSNGGDVFEGIAIGYLFREFAVGTLVRAGDVCFSACALAFLGGSAVTQAADTGAWRTIELGGQVGFHNMWLNQHGLRNSARDEPSNAAIADFDVARAGASLIVRYLTDMGIDATFAARLLGRPTDQFEYIATAGSFVELQTCLTQPVAVLASPEQQADNICTNAIGGTRNGRGNVRPMTAYEARLVLLREVERQGASSAARSRFADRLRSVIAAQNDRDLTDLYAGLQATGLPLPDLSGTLYDVTAAPASLRLSCKVSLPAGRPDEYDLVVVGPRGLSAPARSAPQRCRWLGRHGPADVINPARHAAASTLTMPLATPGLKPATPPAQ